MIKITTTASVTAQWADGAHPDPEGNELKNTRYSELSERVSLMRGLFNFNSGVRLGLNDANKRFISLYEVE